MDDTQLSLGFFEHMDSESLIGALAMFKNSLPADYRHATALRLVNEAKAEKTKVERTNEPRVLLLRMMNVINHNLAFAQRWSFSKAVSVTDFEETIYQRYIDKVSN